MPDWPADKVERRPVEALLPYARNPRTHSEEQVTQLVRSISEWGWTVPVLLDESDGIIAGHGRVLAAKKLGLLEIPCMVAKGWSETQKRAYIIADNQLTLNGRWDPNLLKLELGELKGLDFDLALTGFSLAELGDILADNTEGQGGGAGSLAAQFGVPPFSVLNAREGWWQERKKAWLSLGIQSELGRGQERLEMAHPATTDTIDFYALKRDLEAETGHKLTTPQARAILADRGKITDGRAANASRKAREANAILGGAMLPLKRAKHAKG